MSDSEDIQSDSDSGKNETEKEQYMARAEKERNKAREREWELIRQKNKEMQDGCLLYTSPSPRDQA